MQTAVYLSNRVPRAALGIITLYKALYGKDANLGHLRAIGARAFVHVETYTRKLDPKAWEKRLCGYNMDNKSCRIYNPVEWNVRESRNVIFIETPPTLPDPAPASGLTDGEFTYEDNDDLLRDMMDYTMHLDLDSPADHGTTAPSALDADEMRQLVNNIREITPGTTRAKSIPELFFRVGRSSRQFLLWRRRPEPSASSSSPGWDDSITILTEISS